MKRTILSLAIGILFVLTLSPEGQAKMYVELRNDNVMEGREIDIDHQSLEGALVSTKKGPFVSWFFTRSYESAEPQRMDRDIAFRTSYSIKIYVTDKKGTYHVYGAIYAFAMKSATEIEGGTVTNLDAEVKLGEPYEIDTGMTYDDKKVTMRLLLKSKM